jgi:hypothetical protein
MIGKIRALQANHARLFDHRWSEDELTESDWLLLVGIPWLLDEVERNRKEVRGE